MNVNVRGVLVVAAASLALLAVAPLAYAHQGDPNYRSTLDELPDALSGAEISVLNFDDSLKLVNRTGKTVIIEGYQGDPYIRLNADGTVEVNVNSPAYYLNDDRLGNVPVPENADANAEPEWQVVDSSGQYSWHDHRAHWMSDTMPKQVTDEDVVTKIFDYAIPVTVDGEETEITGTLTWVGDENGGGFPLAALLGLVAIIGAGVAVVILGRRRNQGDGENDVDGPVEGEDADQNADDGSGNEAW